MPIAPTSPSLVPGGSIGEETASLEASSRSHSTVMVFSDSAHLSEDEEPEEEVIIFDAQPTEGRMPNSSYKAEDTLFTWTDITGEEKWSKLASLIFKCVYTVEILLVQTRF